MATYIAPKLRNIWAYFFLLLVSTAFFFWAYLTDHSSSKYGIMFFGIFWIFFIIYSWIWIGKFARKINLNQNEMQVVLQNKDVINFGLADLKEMIIKNRLGYQEVILKNQNGIIKFSSHINNYDDLISIIEKHKQPFIKQKNIKKEFLTYLIAIVFSAIVGLIFASTQKGEIAKTFYTASILLIILSVFLLWLGRNK